MSIPRRQQHALQCLARIAEQRGGDVSAEQISVAEGLSPPYVKHLLRQLRAAGLVKAGPGSLGGYLLARPAAEIPISSVLDQLGPTRREAALDQSSARREASRHPPNLAIEDLSDLLSQVVRLVLVGVTVADLIGDGPRFCLDEVAEGV